MKILNLVRLTIADAFYAWAMREINPLHPDVPHILQRQSEIRDRLKSLFL